MDGEQMPSSNEEAPKLSGLGDRLREKAAEEAKSSSNERKAQEPRTSNTSPSQKPPRGKKRKLEVVGQQRAAASKRAASPSEMVSSPKQATVKMDERMRMAWALLRATSGRTLQELQYEAFDGFLKKQRAYDMVDLHTATAEERAGGS